MIQNLINHIVFVIDGSGSMSVRTKDVERLFNTYVARLAKRSKELDQETRVSVYIFNTSIECLIYDMDVMRLPKLDGYYHPNGGTALIRGTVKAIQDLKETPELYGDHAFLMYVITDGQETENRDAIMSRQLSGRIEELPNNWTLAVLVPDQQGVLEAKTYGFPAENISVWNTNRFNDIEKSLNESTDNFFSGRAQGIRGTKTLFKVNVNVTDKELKKNLVELKPADYTLIPVKTKGQIRDKVESVMGVYEKGQAFYQLTKSEEVQSYKEVCIRDKKTGKVYSGNNARTILGFPTGNAKVSPGDLGKYDVFVQSTSVNRKVVPGTSVLVLS